MDRLVTFSDNDATYKECVACDFKEKQLAQVELDELDTRVNHLPEGLADEQSDIQVVQLVAPPKKII
jgi:Zn ribbon nucleic-acid-binding protein